MEVEVTFVRRRMQLCRFFCWPRAHWDLFIWNSIFCFCFLSLFVLKIRLLFFFVTPTPSEILSYFRRRKCTPHRSQAVCVHTCAPSVNRKCDAIPFPLVKFNLGFCGVRHVNIFKRHPSVENGIWRHTCIQRDLDGWHLHILSFLSLIPLELGLLSTRLLFPVAGFYSSGLEI